MLWFSHKEFKCTLPNNHYLRCWRFPGRWLSNAELAHLRKTIEIVTQSKLNQPPEYGVYLPSREPYENRIITVVYKKNEDKPVAFAAMVHCPVNVRGRIHPVYHLGLVIKSQSFTGRNLLFLIYYYPLAYILTLRGFRSSWITSVSMEPSIIGAVADNLGDVYPHYLGTTQLTQIKLDITKAFVSDFGHEFGIGPRGVLDEKQFVIKGSCRGPSEVLRTSYAKSAKYRVSRCNTFCKNVLDYERGDELLQIGSLSLSAAIKVNVRQLKAHCKRKSQK